MAKISEAQGRKAVVLLSGGLDSMVVAGLVREAGYRLFALTINYNQRHSVELQAAGRIAAHLGAERHVTLPLDLRQFGGSALTDDIAVPKEGVGEDIPVTYVPARNLVFLSLTLAWAEAVGARDIFIGVNAKLANLATKAGAEGEDFTIHAPLQFLGKADIARESARLGLDSGMSWSCYDPQPDGKACGLCDSCRLRLAGFADAGLVDNLPYA